MPVVYTARVCNPCFDFPLQVVQNLLSCLDNPELPFLQWQECFAVLANRLPKELRYEVYSRSSFQIITDFMLSRQTGLLFALQTRS